MKHYMLALALLWSGTAFAVEPREMLKDPALEARAREVSKELRCVVCQNENIDESNAEIAHDMRLLVRERLTAGDTNEQIVGYLVTRYGDYVRLLPRFAPSTLILWFGPLAVLLIGGFVVVSRLKQGGQPAAPLSPEEEAHLAALNVSTSGGGDKAL